jgi:hypothetical protein
VPGTLTLSHEARPTLVMIGSIDPNLGLPASIGTVFGHTRDRPSVFGRTASGQAVTLVDARFALRQMHIEDPESAVFEMVGRVCIRRRSPRSRPCDVLRARSWHRAPDRMA